jgi:hypothetical protein
MLIEMKCGDRDMSCDITLCSEFKGVPCFWLREVGALRTFRQGGTSDFVFRFFAIYYAMQSQIYSEQQNAAI